MTKPHIPQLVKQQATYLRVPDYFWEGLFYPTLAETNRADYWPTTFIEARLIADRINVLHRREPEADWGVSDFLTGGRVVVASAKATAWAAATKQLQAAPTGEVFGTLMPVNSRLYRLAFDRVLDVFGAATTALEQHAHLAAAHALLDGVVRIGKERTLPQLRRTDD